MIDVCQFSVGLSRQLYGRTIASERAGHRLLETWHPLGVVGVITAFNFPVAVWAWNTAVALVCGDTVVWKPSELTPLTALACQALLSRAAADVARRPRWAACCWAAPSVVRNSSTTRGPRQPTRRKRLDHPQKHPRPHRMATTTPPRPRPTPHQHLPPPRTIPPQPRRRRQTRLTPEREPHGAHAPPGPPCSHKPQRPGALTTTHQPFCKAAGVCPRRCGPSPLEQSVGIARLLMAWTARSRAKRCRHDSTASAHRCPRRESMNTWASAAPVAHGLPRWPARLVICVGSPSPARLSRLLGASGSAGRRGGNIHR